MINNYEIRENSLTQNGVYLLFLSADEQGREDVERELYSQCKLTDLKVKGFNFVFELTEVRDENDLEKVRARLDFISSSVAGITQTFENLAKTKVTNIETNASTNSLKIGSTGANMEKGIQQENNIQSQKAPNKQQEGGLPVINLSEPNFAVSNDKRDEMNFKDLPAESTLVSGDEKLIDIEGSSLKIEKTMPNLEQKQSSAQGGGQKISDEKKISDVEEENKTILSFSDEEMKNVSMSIEKEKTGFLGGLFGKIKSAISSKKHEQTIRKDIPAQEKSQFSDLIQGAKEIKKEIVEEFKTEETKPAPVKKQENPFQNLGEGIIVKKGLLNDDEPSVSTIKRELSANPAVSAKLQVDDIFAAETICDFYGNQPEGQSQDIPSVSSKKESPLEVLEKSSSLQTESALTLPTSEEKSSSGILPASEETTPKKETAPKTEPLPKDETLPQPKQPEIEEIQENKEEITLPSEKVFTHNNLQGERAEKTPVKVQGGSPLSMERTLPQPKQPEIEEIQGSEEEMTLPSKKVFTDNKLQEKKTEENPTDTKEDTSAKTAKNSLPVIDKAEETLREVLAEKEDIMIKEKKETEHKESSSDTLKNEGNKNMQEQKSKTQQLPKQQTVHHNTFKAVTTKQVKKIGDKIDHTLHVAAPAKNAKYRNYPIEMPLIPTYTFANMDISAIRFAHAMAMATLDDLGKSNNPFLLQGPGGTGKTHFLHAMGYEISKKIPQAKILFTNGVRFSRGVQYLLEQGQQDKLDKFFNGAEVLIVDDVHLTAVNEHNREYISKVLNDFLKNKKQIILSSKYPPESLKRFEELVNFKFSAGTIAELKVPNKAHFERLTNKIVTSSFLDLTEKQVQSFFSGQNDSLGDVARNVKRVKVLSRRIESSGIKKMSYEDILKEMTAINGENENSDIVKKDFADITVLGRNKENSWGNFGFFFPVSHIDKFRWIAFASQEAAKSLGIKGGFNYALKSAYSTEHIISAAFKIANICDLKGLKGAVILGPAFVECAEPIRDNFYDILTHMLEVMMIRCGTINFEDIKKPSAYVKMLGDILK